MDNSEDTLQLKGGALEGGALEDVLPWLQRPGCVMVQALYPAGRPGPLIRAVIDVAPQRYEPKQRLLLLHNGLLVDATVEASPDDSPHPTRHRLRMAACDASVSMELNEFNHCMQRLGSTAAFLDARLGFLAHMARELEFVEDAITGTRLRVVDQLLNIGVDGGEGAVKTKGVQREGWSTASLKDLAPKLLEPSPSRARGEHTIQPVLLLAEPGTGKTWSAVQLTQQLAAQALQPTTVEGMPLVPVLVLVQKLVRMLNRELTSPLQLTESVILQNLAREYGSNPGWLMMLVQALEMRGAILVMDGIDEAAGLSRLIGDLVHDTLVSSGIRLVATSRPTGVEGSLQAFASHFVIFNLKPLTGDEQRLAVQRQMEAHPKSEEVGHVLEKARPSLPPQLSGAHNPHHTSVCPGVPPSPGPCLYPPTSTHSLHWNSSPAISSSSARFAKSTTRSMPIPLRLQS